MRGNNSEQDRSRLGCLIFLYVLATVSAAAGPAMILGFAFFSLKPVIAAVQPSFMHHRNAILFHPFFPLQATVGLLLGYVNARKWNSKLQVLTWCIPVIFFAYGSIRWLNGASVLASWSERASTWTNHFLGYGCIAPICYDQFIFTLPLLSAIAYSLGASFARLTHHGGPTR